MVKKKVSKKTKTRRYPEWYGTTSLTLAILGFFFLLIFPQVSLIIFLAGGIFGYFTRATDKKNFVLNLVGFILGIVWMIIAYYILLPLVSSMYGGAI